MNPAMRILATSAACIAMSLAGAGTPPRFPPGAVWHKDISAAAVHPNSTTMLSTLSGLGGWGNSNRFQIDFGLQVFHDAPANAPRYSVVPRAGNGTYYTPDCEALPTTMPVPETAAFEGQLGLSCDNANQDCHLLIQQGNQLYELFSGNLSGGVLNAACLVVWNLAVVYPPAGRGDNCTSADAAGFPIAPLLPNADEVAAAVGVANSDLGHAIRFILPNARMASDAVTGGTGGRLYVRPATHAGAPSGPSASVPYGSRLRLKPTFSVAGYNAAAQVILRTMQRYGIVLSDGGNIALAFEGDRFTTAKWSELGIGPHVFWSGANGATPVAVGDFEIIGTGPRIAEFFNCVRTSEPFDLIFASGFDAT